MGLVSAIVAATVVGAGAAAKSVQASQKMTKAINNQTRTQQQIADNENVRTRINSIRATRIARARASAAAVNQGASTSSIAEGVQAGLTSQGNADISFLDKQGALGRQASMYATMANKYQSRAQAWGTLSSLSMQAAGAMWNAGGAQKFSAMFAKKPVTNITSPQPGYTGANMDVVPFT